MAERKPISTAPHDGSKVTVYWTDADGVDNESLAQYRDPKRLAGAGGAWDDSDAGWWVFVDSHTQRRVEPHSWRPQGDDEDA
ncbi:MAG: hypothetical protein JNL61_15090 [Rhizobiaceae bacterium]|nr:hypothetical protein [Rhizobiaceae bacterium]